jgi:hypothetical protein
VINLEANSFRLNQHIMLPIEYGVVIYRRLKPTQQIKDRVVMTIARRG